MKKRNSKSGNEKGATMVEMAIALGLLFGIVGVLFDLGLGLHRYMMLTNVTNEVARNFASGQIEDAELFPHMDCSSSAEGGLRNVIFKESRTILRKAYGLKGNYSQDFSEPNQDFYFDALFKQESVSPSFYSVTVLGKMRLSCIFCHLIPKGLEVSVSSQSLVNTADFSCS